MNKQLNTPSRFSWKIFIRCSSIHLAIYFF